MNKTAWRISSGISAAMMLACAIIAIASIGICPLIECTSGMVPMKCHWAFVADSWIAGAAAIISIVVLVSNNKEARTKTAFASIIVAIVCIIILTPAGIGICGHDDSACHLPAYIMWALCGASIIISLVQLAKADPESADKPKMTV